MHRSSPFRLVLLAACALPAACKSPDPPPPADVPIPSLTGDAAEAPLVRFTEAELPLDAQGTLPDSLATRDVIRLALETSPELQAAMARARLAEADARQERLLPNPILSVSFRLAEGGESPGLDLGIAEDLYAILTRPDRSGIADARLRAAVEEAVTVALDVAAEAATLAEDLRAAEEQVPLLEERRALLEKLRDLAAARLASGEGRPLDVTTAEEEIAGADLDLADARAEARAARIALARRMGRPGDAGRWTIAPRAAAVAAGTEEEWLRRGAEMRPEVRALSWEIAALEGEARLAGLVQREGLSIGADAEGTKDWESGPSFAVPLPFFDDGKARADAALARLADARHRRTAERRRAVEEVRTAWNAHAAANEAARIAAERLVPLAERRRAESDAVFRAGEADVTDVLLAEKALRDARLRIAELRARSSRAHIRLHRAAGGAAPLQKAPAESRPAEGGSHEGR